ncbi:unnamed protein product [Fructobacillus fructosus]|nr:unnamed protein product [Fructobacillus fructosus]
MMDIVSKGIELLLGLFGKKKSPGRTQKKIINQKQNNHSGKINIQIGELNERK